MGVICLLCDSNTKCFHVFGEKAKTLTPDFGRHFDIFLLSALRHHHLNF